MKEGDMIDQLFIANSHDRILCFSDFGRMYCLDVYALPEGSRTSKGRPIINSVPLSEGERITVVLPIEDFDDKHYGHGQRCGQKDTFEGFCQCASLRH